MDIELVKFFEDRILGPLRENLEDTKAIRREVEAHVQGHETSLKRVIEAVERERRERRWRALKTTGTAAVAAAGTIATTIAIITAAVNGGS